MLITAKMNRKFGACYSDDRLAELYGNGKTPEQVATLTDGLWAEVSTADRCWILWRVIATKNKAGMRECLARMLDRVLRPDCDPRIRAVVEAIRQDVVTEEIIAAAYAAEASARAATAANASAAEDAYAARVAYAASLAYAAGRASVYAAGRASVYAAYAAAAADAAAAVAARAAYEAYAAAVAARNAAAAEGAEMKAQIADILQFLKDI